MSGQDSFSRIKNLSPAKRALLLKKLREQKTSAVAGIPPRPDRRTAPLSYAQRRLWFIQQLDPDDPALNMPAALRLRGRIVPDHIRRALEAIVQRHEPLRTTFEMLSDAPIQHIHDALSPEFGVRDLSSIQGPGRLEAEIQAEIRRPIKIDQAPPVRGTLFQLGEDEAVVLFIVHHVAIDGWSWPIFFREFMSCLEALYRNAIPDLPALQTHYADFAIWQQAELTDERIEELTSFWKAYLHAASPQLRLPVDLLKRRDGKLRGRNRHFRISDETATDMRALASNHGATLYMTLFAAFNALLSRMTGQADLTLGSPVAARPHEHLEGLIGCFMNPLPIRTDLSGDPTFLDLLARVKRSSIEALAHQDLPFDMLVKAVQAKRDLGNLPLFQGMFVLQNYPQRDVSLAELHVTREWVDTELIYPVALTMAEDGRQLVGEFEFAECMYASVFSDMPAAFARALEAIAANPNVRLSELPFLDAKAQHHVLGDLAHGTTTSIQYATVQDMFVARARSKPDAIALVADGALLSYGELERRSRCLSNDLQRKNIGPEVRVGLACRRSPEMLVGMLAILRAGGCYVPLDPDYPAERLRAMALDAQTELVLTDGETGELLAQSGLTLRSLDSEDSAIAEGTGENGGGPSHRAQQAYVIYTSGSTGKPKGVMVEHGALANYVEAARRRFDLTAEDSVLQFASLSFDTAAEEIYPSLAAGATLVLRDDEAAGSADGFIAWVATHQVTVLDLPTAYWHELASEFDRRNTRLPACVRVVILGGERVRPDRVALWQAHHTASPELLNTYGPTETTIVAALCSLSNLPEDPGRMRELPIGRPVDNVRTYVVTHGGQARVQPPGVVGELLIGGAGLARGYLDRPALTADSFRPDGFSGAAGARLYRSGDLARFLPDGLLEYNGRVDKQIKIRGFRIEPGEIEAALTAIPNVQDAIVVPHQAAGGQLSLAAYLVLTDDARFTTRDVRHFLKSRLPNFMLPNHIAVLDTLPVNVSGKIDISALPAPDMDHATTGTPAQTPSTRLETQLAAIWADVLQLEAVGVHDNFFELGGDSIISLQIIARALDAGIKMTPRHLFEFQTIAEIARGLEDDKDKTGGTEDTMHHAADESVFGWTADDVNDILTEIDGRDRE